MQKTFPLHLLRSFLLLLLCQPLVAQSDSTVLALQQLGANDLYNSDIPANKVKVVGASRSLKNLGDLPFTIHVVSKEDIFRNGYTTLVDVLKHVPGIRVSQPGSAIEGETFLMRGLLGNEYTKILINDMPIKPAVVKGMPIGAQIPIKQAERIEIIYGPAAAIYGADASAGVINIILKETERPTYAQADLSAGINGFSNVDVLFGGKVGRDKNVLRFNLYGSNTVMNDRRVFYDLDNLYNPIPYSRLGNNNLPDTSYLNNANYRGTATRPTLSTMPHLSRNFGANIRFRDLYLSFDLMYRRDHSSIGLNPLAVAYYNPLNYTGENIVKIHGAFKKRFKKWGFQTNANYIRYEMDNRSSNIYIQNSLFQAAEGLAAQFLPSPMVLDSLKKVIFQALFSRIRFSYAESHDLRFEQLFDFTLWKNAELIIGASTNLSAALPVVNFMTVPFEGEVNYGNNYVFTGDAPIEPSTSFEGDGTVFAQVYVNFDRLKAILGIQSSRHSKYGSATNPRLAALYQFNPSFSLRASFGNAFRAPTPFYNANTYQIIVGNLSSLRTSDNVLRPEKTTSYELGGRWNGKHVHADISAYYYKTRNFISFNFDTDTKFGEGITEFEIGYFNKSNSSATLYGIQSFVEFTNILPQHDTNIRLALNYNEGKEILPDSLGKLNDVRAQPQFLAQCNISFKVLNRLYLSFNNILVTKSISRRVLRTTNLELRRDQFTNDGYYTLDLMARMPLTNNFQAYIKVNNVFNRQYAGIGATGTVDDLEYNPQSLRTGQIGISYRMF